MSSLSPRATLLLLLGLAAIILGAGLRLARQEELVRVDRDREALRRFSSDAQTELERLEALYERHLTELGYLTFSHFPRKDRSDGLRDPARRRDRLVGIRQFSLLHREAKDAGSDLHVIITASPRERTPVPAFEAPRDATERYLLLLSPRSCFKHRRRGAAGSRSPASR